MAVWPLNRSSAALSSCGFTGFLVVSALRAQSSFGMDHARYALSPKPRTEEFRLWVVCLGVCLGLKVSVN